MPNIRHSLQSLADALSPDTNTHDGYVDNAETSLTRIADALPKKLGGKIEAESLAAEYDDQATYDIGDYCTHDGVFYICATAIAIAESWNSAKWVAVPIIEILQEKLNAPADGAVAGRYLMVGQNGEPVWDQLDESDIRQSVYDWLSAHPEAIVVNDGTITRAKLDSSVGQAVDDVAELKTGVSDLQDRKADNDGYYQEMSVGDAEQLIATTFVSDNAAYTHRTTGGSADVGDREYLDAIVGGSIVWNQLLRAIDGTRSSNGVTLTSEDGIVTIAGTATANSIFFIGDISLKGGWVYLLRGCPQGGSSTTYRLYANQTTPQLLDNGSGSLRKQNTDTTGSFYIIVYAGATVNLTFTPQLFDLTQMFGSAIANSIYNLEQATPGAGVAWFKRYFPKDYYPYDAGTIKSIEGLDSHDTVGFNLFDKETATDGKFINGALAEISDSSKGHSDYISVFPSTQYYCTGFAGMSYYAILWCDVNKQAIADYSGASKSAPFRAMSPSNARYAILNYNLELKNSVCFNLSWDGEKDGTYEPYEEHSYPLDSSLTLKGIPKLDSANNLYYDGDRYLPDGTVERRYGIADLGTLTWYADSNRTGVFYSTTLSSLAKGNGGIFTAEYIWRNGAVPDPSTVSTYNKLISLYPSYGGGYCYIVDHAFDGMSTSEVKTALSGKIVVYELRTPTTETAESYNSVQVIDDFGTEEFVSSSLIPVGHETRYAPNLRAKLEMAPDSPAGDGDYAVRQEAGQNSYIPLESTTVIQNLVANKANVDGSYSDLTAGNAEQLVSTVYEEDSVPYIFRTAGGSMDIGDREEDMLVGGTVAWNQIFPNPVEMPSTTKAFPEGTQFVAGHKLLFRFNGGVVDPNANVPQLYLYLRPTQATLEAIRVVIGVGCKILTFNTTMVANGNTNADGAAWIYIAYMQNLAFGSLDVFDLTQMFGSTIADYVYNLERSTAGAGVAWFRKLFPADYYPYDAGTLKSVEGVSSHDMVGFNQWDEEWEVGAYNTVTGAKTNITGQIRCKNLIPVIPGQTYHATNIHWAGFMDVNGRAIETPDVGIENVARAGNAVLLDITNEVFTAPQMARGMWFYNLSSYGSVYRNNICINLHWDGERNGEYEPHVKRSYPLDSSLTLRGIPKLDSANNLYYDGDTYESDGTVTRRYGVMDLGRTNYVKTSSGLFSTSAVGPVIKKASNNQNPTGYIFSPLYQEIGATPITGPNGANPSPNMVMAVNVSGNLFFNNTSYTDPADFKTAMSGVYLVYELAEPATETAEPYQNPQIVDDFGTEEYVTTSIVPVGHVTKYQPNLRAKLEMSPDSPDGDGDYIVRQANGENSYVSLTSTTVIQNITNRVSTVETTVGNHTADINRKAPVIFDTATGSVATFPDGADGMSMQSVVAQIVPVQDFHGQVGPYPAGGGKNKVDINNPLSSSPAVSVQNNVIVGTNGYTNSGIVYEVNGLTVGSPYYASVVIKTNTTGYRIAILVVDGGTGESYTASTGTIGFTFNPTNETVQIKVEQRANGNWSADQLQLEAGTSKTDFAPYSNICPISGWDAVNVVRGGINVMPSAPKGTQTVNGITVSCDGNGTYTVSGTSTVATNIYFYLSEGFTIPVSIVNGSVGCCYFFNSTTDATISVMFLNDDTVVDGWGLNPINRKTSTYGKMGNKYCNRFGLSFPANCTANFTVSPMFTIDGTSNRTAFVPFTGSAEIYPVSLPQTVYGGEVDVVSGEGKVTYGMVDLGTLNWTYSNGFFRASLNPMHKRPSSQLSTINALCTIYTNTTWHAVGNGDKEYAFSSDTNSPRLLIKDSSYTTTADFKSAVSGVILVYELDTPTDFSITPQTVPTLYGSNTVYADSGDVAVEYPADTKLYINKVITTAVSALS